MNKRWWAIGAIAVVIGVGVLLAKGGDKTRGKAGDTPFRIGKVQAEDLQVSVREVGVVDPYTKVDVKTPFPDAW